MVVYNERWKGGKMESPRLGAQADGRKRMGNNNKNLFSEKESQTERAAVFGGRIISAFLNL